MRIEDVICPFCGCLCDDLVVEMEGTTVLSVENGCTLAYEKFNGDHRLLAPIKRDGITWHQISYDEAIETTAQVLLEADRPLLYGWSVPAVRHRDRCPPCRTARAVIDNTSTVCTARPSWQSGGRSSGLYFRPGKEQGRCDRILGANRSMPIPVI